MLNRLLLFQILDANRDSPHLQFTVVIKHATGSTVDANDVTIYDSVEKIALYSHGVKPQGTTRATSDYRIRGYSIVASVAKLTGKPNHCFCFVLKVLSTVRADRTSYLDIKQQQVIFTKDTRIFKATIDMIIFEVIIPFLMTKLQILFGISMLPPQFLLDVYHS